MEKLDVIEYKALRITYDRNQKKERWLLSSRRQLKNNKDVNIVKQYNYERRGLYNYYQIANNAPVLHKFNSLLRTLTDKYRKSVKKIRTRFDVYGQFGVRYQKGSVEKVIMYYNQGFRRKDIAHNSKDADLQTEYKYPFGRYSPAYRLKRKSCECVELQMSM